MKKVILSTGLALALIASAGAVSTTATPSTHKVYVDGEKANVAAYEINGNNFFKLRDIAAILNGTDAQFEVTWNGAENRIDLTDGKAYTTVGGELETIPAGTQTANLSTAWVYQDGRPASLTGFEINGNNYYKLRDVADAFDFNVTWDGETQRVDIITTESYDDGEESDEPAPPEYNSEYKQAYETLDYDEVNPDYQAQVDAFPGTPVTVSVELKFYDIKNNRYIYPADLELRVVANRPNPSNDYDDSFPETTAVKKIKTDSTGHVTLTVDIPESVYEKMKDNKDEFYSISGPDLYGHDFTYEGKTYSAGGDLTYNECEAGSVQIVCIER